jgi:U3 small nucleolar RNA-associated protein 18
LNNTIEIYVINIFFIVDLPIFCANWNADGSEIIATGRKPYFYVYNVQAGKVDRVKAIKGT